MSIKVMSWVWESGPAKQAERFVLLALADFCNDASECWPSIDGIARKTCLTPRGVQKILRSLEADGWLVTVVGGGRKGCNQYRIIPPNEVRPERGSPRTTGTTLPNESAENPERGSPEPSRTTIEPSEEDIARSSGAPDFDAFWTAYPKKVGKDAARAAWGKAKKRAPSGAIMDGLRAFVAATRGGDPQFIPYPTTWLNQGRWQDETLPNVHPFPSKGQARGERYAALSAELDARLAERPFD